MIAVLAAVSAVTSSHVEPPIVGAQVWNEVVPGDDPVFEPNACVRPLSFGRKIGPRVELELSALIGAGAPCVVIESPGGDGLTALEIVEAGNAAGTTFYFTGRCASACVHLAVLADLAVFAGEASLIVHATSWARYEAGVLSLRGTDVVVPQMAEMTMRLAADRFTAAAAVADAGGGDGFVRYNVDSLAYLEPVCIKDRSGKLDQYHHDAFELQRPFFAPSRELLLRWRDGRQRTELPLAWPRDADIPPDIPVLPSSENAETAVPSHLPVCNAR